MMLRLSATLTVACLIGAPCVLIVARLVGSAHGRISSRLQDFSAEAFNIAEETIQNIRTVRSFGKEKEESERFQNILQRSYRVSLIQAALTAAQKWFVEVSNIVHPHRTSYCRSRVTREENEQQH
jgi:ABC-type multidrug transport system fused ATPase/permease subunit